MTDSYGSTIDAGDLREVVSGIARGRPDHRYVPYEGSNHALYVHPDGSEGCLFGVALLSMGVSVEVLRSCGRLMVPELPFLTGSGPVKYELLDVQYAQDIGLPWGTAIES